MSTKKSKNLFLIVPGIGAEAPGDTLKGFVKTIGVQLNNPFTEKEQLLHLSTENNQNPKNGKKDIKDNFQETFIVPRQELETDEKEFHFAELYWDDLSSIKNSVLDLIKNFFNLLFGLRYFIEPLSEAKDEIKTMKPLTWMNNFFFAVLRGPIYALNILIVVYVLAAVGFHSIYVIGQMNGGEILATHKSDAWTYLQENSNVLFMVISLSLTFFLFLFKREAKDDSILHSWTNMSLIGLSAISVVIFCIIEFFVTSGDDSIYGMKILEHYIYLLVGFWVLLNLILLINLCFMLTALRIVIRKAFRPGILLNYLTQVLSITFWIMMVPVLFFGALKLIPEVGWFDQLEEFLKIAFPIIGYVWIASICLIPVVIYALLSRDAWVGSNYNEGENCIPEKLPRLIIHRSVAACMLIFPAFLVILMLANPEFCLKFLYETPDKGLYLFGKKLGNPDMINGFAFVTIPLLLPVIFYFRNSIRIGLDIAMDVVNYFKPKLAQTNSAFLPEKPEYPIRGEINSRLKAILEHFKASKDSYETLNIISHSQGTILIIDFLAMEANKKLLRHFKKVNLITMGSPLTHLYQHYFPGMFGGESDTMPSEKYQPKWDYFYGKKTSPLKSWKNIYRVDDYIGTHVKVPKRMQQKDHIAPENVCIGLGGHTFYFVDTRVWAQIDGLFK